MQCLIISIRNIKQKFYALLTVTVTAIFHYHSALFSRWSRSCLGVQMVNLVIMRHGDAEPHSSQDSQRQLTAKGRDEVSQMALWVSQHYQAFDLVLCSPYVRTRQTADLMLNAQPAGVRLEILPELVPEGDSHQVQLYIDALRENNKELRLLLVSHMPLVSFLVETFTKSGNTPIFETSGLVGIHYQPGEAGKLLERLAPADLALLSH